MEISVAKKDLLRLVSRMQGVAERKSTMPVLSNVLVTVDGPGHVRLAATDLYLGLVGRAPADIKKPGSLAIPAKELAERIKMMPDGPIVLSSTDGASTVLKAPGTARRYTLRGMPGDDFPPLPTPAEGAPTLSLEAKVLAQLIARTHYAISSDETRAHLNSALFEWDGDVVRMVTTDGHRLSKAEVKLEGRQGGTSMLIPLKAIQELRRLCDEVLAEPREAGAPAPALSIAQSGSNAFFASNGSTFSVKLVDAQFPPYQQVIPKGSDKNVRAPRTALSDALKAVSLAASERTGGVKLSLAKGSLRISSESPESGEGFDELAVEYDGASMSIGFNAKYFLDVLAAIDDDEVQVGLSGELDPAVLRPGTNKAGELLAVVMPMRI